MRRAGRPALLVLLLLVWVTPTGARAGDALQDRFQEANGHYYKKRYGQAKAIYLDLIESFHIQDPVVFYNLANTYQKAGELGRAVVNYKRALAQGPGDELEKQVRENLAQTTEALIDRHRKEEIVQVLDETHGVAYSVGHLLPSDLVAWMFLVFWVAFFGALIGRRALRTEGRRWIARTTAITVAAPLLLSGLLLVLNVVTTHTVDRAIIVEGDVLLRDGKHRAATASDVPEGLEVRILDDSDPCQVRIQLSNGKQGWVPARTVERITAGDDRPLVVQDPGAACEGG